MVYYFHYFRSVTELFTFLLPFPSKKVPAVTSKFQEFLFTSSCIIGPRYNPLAATFCPFPWLPSPVLAFSGLLPSDNPHEAGI